ncbi:UNVERIFIED_CONTAM: hypothetical protein GTU68_041619 [Idotea baltica]|nr:hypothetical protein [Idotea baltica]
MRMKSASRKQMRRVKGRRSRGTSILSRYWTVCCYTSASSILSTTTTTLSTQMRTRCPTAVASCMPVVSHPPAKSLPRRYRTTAEPLRIRLALSSNLLPSYLKMMLRS